MSESNNNANSSNVSVKDCADLGIFQHLMGLQEELVNNRRMRAMGDAQLQEHFAAYDSPQGDDVLQYHSPTTHNYYSGGPGGKKLSTLGAVGLTAMLLASGGGLAYIGYMLGQRNTPAPTDKTDTDTQYRIELVDE